MRTPGKTKLLSILVLLLGCFVASAGEKEIVKDKSPDGKFALRITKGDGDWEAAIIEVRTKQKVTDLDAYGSYAENARLVWSKDSKRVAHFGPDRRGGTTTVYFRNGSKFQEVQFPYADIPGCGRTRKPEGDENASAQSSAKYLKTIEYRVEPERWLKSGALVVEIYDEWLMESGASFRCGETVTIAFDASRKASVESVKDKKLERE